MIGSLPILGRSTSHNVEGDAAALTQAQRLVDAQWVQPPYIGIIAGLLLLAMVVGRFVGSGLTRRIKAETMWAVAGVRVFTCFNGGGHCRTYRFAVARSDAPVPLDHVPADPHARHPRLGTSERRRCEPLAHGDCRRGTGDRSGRIADHFDLPTSFLFLAMTAEAGSTASQVLINLSDRTVDILKNHRIPQPDGDRRICRQISRYRPRHDPHFEKYSCNSLTRPLVKCPSNESR